MNLLVTAAARVFRKSVATSQRAFCVQGYVLSPPGRRCAYLHKASTHEGGGEALEIPTCLGNFRCLELMCRRHTIRKIRNVLTMTVSESRRACAAPRLDTFRVLGIRFRLAAFKRDAMPPNAYVRVRKSAKEAPAPSYRWSMMTKARTSLPKTTRRPSKKKRSPTRRLRVHLSFVLSLRKERKCLCRVRLGPLLCFLSEERAAEPVSPTHPTCLATLAKYFRHVFQLLLLAPSSPTQPYMSCNSYYFRHAS